MDAVLAAHIQVAAVAQLAGVLEAAFLHNAARGLIVHEEIAPQCLETFYIEAVVNHLFESLGANALIPEWLANPVSDFGIVPAYFDIALALNEITYATNRFVGFFQNNCPGMVICENALYDLETLLHVFVGSPAGTGTHIGVRSESEQIRCIGIPPRTQD